MPSILWFVLVLAALQVRPAVPSNSSPARASIEGVVTRAGAAAGASQQLANVVVELKPGNLWMTTGPNGAFAFRNLVPGRYTLTAKRDGFVPVEDARRGQSSSGVTITVTAGQTAKNIVLPMVSAPTISGQVYDPYGEPLAAAVVQAHFRRYTPYGPQLKVIKKTMTNDLGEFRLFWLPFGQYVVSATYGERALASALGSVRLSANVPKPDQEYIPVFFGGAIQSSQGQPVRLAPGADAGGLTISLNDVARFKIRGRIIPAAPESTIAFAPEGNDLAAEGNNFNNLIRPNAAGEFEIPGVAPGLYVLIASAERSSSALTTILVAKDDVNVTLPMLPAMNINGSVYRSSTDFSDSRVKLVRSSREIDQKIESPITRQGAFTLFNVGVGDYDITVEPLPPNAYVKNILQGGRELLGGLVRLSDVSSPLQILLGNAGASVVGHVDKAGDAIEGAQVVLIPEERFRRRTDRYITGLTDAMGNFELSAVPPGRYTAYAFEDIEPGAYYAFAYSSAANLRFADRGVAVTVEDSGVSKLQLKAIPAAETAGGFQ